MIRILVVEDDPDNMGLVRFVLERAGYSVIEAYDGKEALTITRQTLPDLVLCDLAIPEIDGWTVTKTLKTDPATQNIPVVALTVRSLLEDRLRAVEAGCDGYISKPMDIRAFITEVASFLPAHDELTE